LVEDWIGYYVDGAKSTDSRFAAWERVDELVRSDSEAGLELVRRLAQAAPDDLVLSNVAAGPLEDLLTKHGEAVLDHVEELARRDPNFRRCLTGVWGLPKLVAERLAEYVRTVPNPL
jgi:hypothetical protein